MVEGASDTNSNVWQGVVKECPGEGADRARLDSGSIMIARGSIMLRVGIVHRIFHVGETRAARMPTHDPRPVTHWARMRRGHPSPATSPSVTRRK